MIIDEGEKEKHILALLIICPISVYMLFYFLFFYHPLLTKLYHNRFTIIPENINGNKYCFGNRRYHSQYCKVSPNKGKKDKYSLYKTVSSLYYYSIDFEFNIKKRHMDC